MADILVLEASAARHRGSSPLLGTTTIVMKKFILLTPLLGLVACTTTRTNIDDHSFHYSGPPPVNKVEYHTHNHIKKTYRQSTIQESDQDYINDHPVKPAPTSYCPPPPTPAPSPYWYFQPQPVQRVAYTPPPARLQPYVTPYPVLRPSAPIGSLLCAEHSSPILFSLPWPQSARKINSQLNNMDHTDIQDRYMAQLEFLQEALEGMREIMQEDEFIDWSTDTTSEVAPKFPDFISLLEYIDDIRLAAVEEELARGEIQETLAQMVENGEVVMCVDDEGEIRYKVAKKDTTQD